jgi:hypothetical protein
VGDDLLVLLLFGMIQNFVGVNFTHY